MLSFDNTDMAFDGNTLVVGNYHGFNIYNIEDGSTTYSCQMIFKYHDPYFALLPKYYKVTLLKCRTTNIINVLGSHNVPGR